MGLVSDIHEQKSKYWNETGLKIVLNLRDVVTVNGPLSPQKRGPSILLLNKILKHWARGAGPPGPSGDYTPASNLEQLKYLLTLF